ncbi:hypothetical protein DL93DRAFT_1183282 [Clavulina sp. PMI_390]|nr:hypothetical protein DL93DRAFT_1183282 [Clavulina sp. PMI_390]
MRRWTSFSILCKRSQFEAITFRLKELEGDKTALAAFCQSQNDLLDEEQKQVNAIYRWIVDRVDERFDELVVVRNERITDLKNHLEAHGYPRELLESIDPWTYRSMPTMRQSKRLTDRIWAKQQNAILPHVEKAVETLREHMKKIARNRAADAVRDECIRRLPTTDHLPCNGWPNYSRLSREILLLLEDWAEDDGFYILLRHRLESSEPPILPSEALTLISEYVTHCTQRVRNHFTNILQRRTDLPPSLSDSEMLDLAVVVFHSVKDGWGRRGLPYRALHRYYDSVLYLDQS